jgi:hypothetical protein
LQPQVADLLGVLPHGAPVTEYDPEMEDFAALIAAGTPITPEIVAGVGHKWFGTSEGDSTGEPEPPTPAGPPWPLTCRTSKAASCITSLGRPS